VIFSVPPGKFLKLGHGYFLPRYFQFSYNHPIRNRKSLVGTATSFGLDGPGFEFQKEQEIFPAPKRPYWLWGPSTLQSNGHHDSFPGLKRPGRAVDHSSPSSAKVKNELSYSFTPPTRLHGVDMDNLTSYYP